LIGGGPDVAVSRARTSDSREHRFHCRQMATLFKNS
jgi:hypothetical protein